MSTSHSIIFQVCGRFQIFIRFWFSKSYRSFTFCWVCSILCILLLCQVKIMSIRRFAMFLKLIRTIANAPIMTLTATDKIQMFIHLFLPFQFHFLSVSLSFSFIYFQFRFLYVSLPFSFAFSQFHLLSVSLSILFTFSLISIHYHFLSVSFFFYVHFFLVSFYYSYIQFGFTPIHTCFF